MTNEGHIHKMKLSSLNLFSELVVEKLGYCEKTKVEIVDCENFFVVKGKTSAKEIVDLNKLKEEFTERFSNLSDELNIGNTIDLMEYGVKIEKQNVISFEFINSVNLIDSDCEISNYNKSLTFKSEFPHGFSPSMGKNLYLYAKHIVYNLQSKYTWNKLIIELSETDIEQNLKIYTDVCDEPNDKIKSSILDAFTFNYSSFEKSYSKSNWWEPIFDRSKEFDFVKSINKDLIIF